MLLAKDSEWRAADSAPFDHDLELAVIFGGEAHTLVFPSRRILHGWTNVETKQVLNVRPTHWREWHET
jgi:hypothetical protein